jgi:hypothetical protein
MNKPELIFNFYNLKMDDSFRFGKLILRAPDKNLRFHATSGLANFQQIGSCGLVGRGAIPPCELVSIPTYTVNTCPIPMAGKRGIEGNFYQIFPHVNKVEVNNRTSARGDFGIHQDAGIKGTAGCIGVTKGMHWKAFQMEMQSLFVQGFKNINLFVPVGY